MWSTTCWILDLVDIKKYIKSRREFTELYNYQLFFTHNRKLPVAEERRTGWAVERWHSHPYKVYRPDSSWI